MRIISGTLKNRQFDAPGTFKTHPMSDKARGALFNILGDIEDLTVLDAFAGSGALSFEAASRGAKSVTAIEIDRPAQKIIASNIASLGAGDTVHLITASANAWLQTTPDTTFDLVLCDPPYDDMQLSLLTRLASRVSQDGVLVLSLPKDMELPSFEGFDMLDSRTYSRATLAFYKHSV